jgi:hypothetical protein
MNEMNDSKFTNKAGKWKASGCSCNHIGNVHAIILVMFNQLY